MHKVQINIRGMRFLVLALAAVMFAAAPLRAGEQEENKEGGFDAGNFIIDHIKDAHEWHILTWDGHHVSIPLPIIVYSQEQGTLHLFMSSAFHHGHAAHNGLALVDGEIVEAEGSGEHFTVKENAATPLDFSITKDVLELFVIATILLWLFISVARAYRRREGKAPKGLQSVMEVLILFIRDDVAVPAIGAKKAGRYLPYLLTLFFFIFFGNLLGLVPLFPGGANLTGNITITMVLALFTFAITTFSGNKAYWLHIFNTPGVPWWLKAPIPLMPLVEFMGIFIKPFVLMVRLFANITAGHIIALGFFSLIFIFGEMHVAAGYGASVVSIAFTVFMTMLELLVAFIQAYVFTLLSALYFGMATEEHH